MSFLQPALAVSALVAASVPFLLHLLLRRPRTTEWPSTMLLRRALERLRRHRRLEQWVLLALRSLALLLAGFGMAGPIARAIDDGVSSRELWLVIDDGATSAERAPDGVTALERSRTALRRELDALRSGDRVALVVAAQPVDVRVQPTTDFDRVRRELDSLQSRAVPSNLPAALEKCLPTEPGAAREVLVGSSFRRGSVDVEVPIPSAWKERAKNVLWSSTRPWDSNAPNRSIASVTIGRGPGDISGSGDVPVRVDLARTGGEAGTDPVLVRSPGGEWLGRSDAAWSAGGTAIRQEVQVRTPKDGAFVIEVSGDAQPLDDTAFVVSTTTGAPRVCVVGRRLGESDIERLPASAWITRALEAAGLQPQEVEPSTLALRPPREADTLIVTRPDLVDAAGWSWIGGFTRDGGVTLLMPVSELATQTWMSDADRAIGMSTRQTTQSSEGSFRLAARQPRSRLLALLGAEVDALAEPVSVGRRWTMEQVGADSQVALAFEDGSPAMLVTRPRDGVGVVIQLAFPPEIAVTDLPLKPLMVPLFQEIARAGRLIASMQQSCWSGQPAWVGSGAAGGLLRAIEGGAVIEVDADGRTTAPLPSPGIWKVEQRDGRSRLLAVGLDPRAASIDRVEPAAFESWRSAIGPWNWCGERVVPDERSIHGDESSWTTPLLAMALVLLLVECAWSRRGSPVGRSEGATT